MEQTIKLPDGYVLEKVSDTEYRVVPVKKTLPKTWEEFCENFPYHEGEGRLVSTSTSSYISSPSKGGIRDASFDKALLPSIEKARAIIALCQLIQLKDCYNDGWNPDWTNCKTKYCLSLGPNGWYPCTSGTLEHIFTFKTEKLRDEFALNFKYLLDELKPLFE